MSDATKKGLLLGAGVLALLALLALFTGVFGLRPMMYGPGGMMGDGFASFPWMLIPFLLAFGLLALLAWAVVLIGSGRSKDGGGDRNSAEETLRPRFARGEIDAEGYERVLRTLRSDATMSRDRAPR